VHKKWMAAAAFVSILLGVSSALLSIQVLNALPMSRDPSVVGATREHGMSPGVRPEPSAAAPTTCVPPSSTPEPTAVPSATVTRTPKPTSTSTDTPTPTPTPTAFQLYPSGLINVTATHTDTTAVPTPVSAVEVAPGSINIIVLGSDRRADWNDWHTDVVQLVSIQPLVPAVTIVSIPRDLYVYIPGFWMSRINFADMYGELYGYDGGGPALVQQTLLYNLGVSIDHYVRTDFAGFKGIVDTLGGIDVPVHCRLSDYWPYPDENGEYQIKVFEPGVHHMDGATALWYARSRKTSSVFARERRQQQVLEGIWRQSRSLDLLPRLPSLYEQFRGMVVTDLGFGDVLTLAEIAFRLDTENVRFRNVGYRDVVPWTTPKGGNVFLPNWEQIQPLLSEALGPVPEGRLWRKLQTIEVWNGTMHPDWDQLAADRLSREGFVAVPGAADRRDHEATHLVDFTGTSKGSAIPYLQWMFNIPESRVLSEPNPDAGVQYRLVIGYDYLTCRSP
jgi:LCP family protein required for cell wall assembly